MEEDRLDVRMRERQSAGAGRDERQRGIENLLGINDDGLETLQCRPKSDARSSKGNRSIGKGIENGQCGTERGMHLELSCGNVDVRSIGEELLFRVLLIITLACKRNSDSQQLSLCHGFP